MKFSLFKNYGALNSKPVFEAFERSLQNEGHTVLEDDMHADVAVIWSVLWHGRMVGNKPIWDYYRKTGRNVIVLEVGGINRGTTWKVGLNGINKNSVNFIKDRDITSNSVRADNLGLKLKPWNTDGEYILICGQHDKSLQWKDMPSMSNWFLQIYDEIRKHTDRPIIFRPHPRCRLEHIERGLKNVYRQEPKKLEGSYDDFDMGFNDIYATISHSSNPGIHSIINGIAAFVSSNSIAYPVAHDIKYLNNIENLYTPYRQLWLNNYAWTEFTVDEISNGTPLKYLTPYL